MPRPIKLLVLAMLFGGALPACDADDDAPATLDAGAPDGNFGPDPETGCAPCAVDQVCVHYFDGTCISLGYECVDTDLDCPIDSCSPECKEALCGDWYCGSQYSCGEPPGAFGCYGP